MLNHSQ